MTIPEWPNKLSDRIDDLPLVIAGPILRRVEKDQVSVWIVFKEEVSDIKLAVFKDYDICLESSSTEAIKLGEKLFMSVVTANLPGPDPELQQLEPDTNYDYNISFFHDAENASKTLYDHGVISNANTLAERMDLISYKDEGLPSFALPPSDINNLRVVHASCRKPHGGKDGALSTLDVMIENSRDGSNIIDPKHRPHLLFMTGDQIYADDVADALLYMLDNAIDALAGWKESLPLIQKWIPDVDQDKFLDPNFDSYVAALRPGVRSAIIRDENDKGASFSVDKDSDGDIGKSHLMHLMEYILMYVFVWSDVLWPPKPEEQEATNDSGMPNSEHVFLNGLDSNKKTIFNNENKALSEFRKDLPYVRKALANVPTYMMFDDHEVTDDWFLRTKWVQNTIGLDNVSGGSSLGRRIIQNGMAAYALCQAWGNTPDRFKSGTDGSLFLSSIGDLVTSSINDPNHHFDDDGNDNNPWQKLGIYLLPELKAYDNLKDHYLSYKATGIRWDYTIEYPYFEVVVLNIRTERAFIHRKNGSERAAVSLISPEAMVNQIPASSKPTSLFTIFISPAPVIGHPFVEFIQVLTGGSPEKVDGSGMSKGERKRDHEAWFFDTVSQQELLYRMAKHKNSIILCGDVHYSFSAEIRYWNERGDEPANSIPNSIIAQLTASSLKNETDGPFGTTSPYTPAPKNHDAIFWDGANQNIDLFKADYRALTPGKIFRGSVTVKGENRLHGILLDEDSNNYTFLNIKAEYTLLNDPTWRYSVRFLEDTRLKTERSVTILNTPNTTSQFTKVKAARYHFGNAKLDKSRKVVGIDNIGEINFANFDNDPNMNQFNHLNKIIHKLWYNPSSSYLTRIAEPLTNHQISFNSPSLTDPKPGE